MYRDRLPQLEGGLFITDGGIETTLIYHRGLELPAFAAFDLLRRLERPEAASRAYARALELATNPVERRFIERRLSELA